MRGHLCCRKPAAFTCDKDLSLARISFAMKSLPFAEALAMYPAFIRELASNQGITTTTALWILGDAQECMDRTG